MNLIRKVRNGILLEICRQGRWVDRAYQHIKQPDCGCYIRWRTAWHNDRDPAWVCIEEIIRCGEHRHGYRPNFEFIYRLQLEKALERQIRKDNSHGFAGQVH